MRRSTIFKKFAKIFALYGIQIWLMLFVSNVAVISFIRYKAQAQSCMNTAQINADSRCLYILSGSIYSKGTRIKPHHSHPCGMDVTSIIPAFHNNNAAKYLLPNFVAPLCNTGPNPTPIPTPTRTPTPRPPTIAPTNPPTNAPTRTPTAAPTRTPTVPPVAQTPTIRPTGTITQPTRTPTFAPFSQPTPTPTQIAFNNKKTSTPTATATPKPATTLSPSPTAFLSTPSPVATSLLFSIMSQLDNSINETPKPTAEAVANTSPITENLEVTNVPEQQYLLIYWTTIISYVTFGILLLTAGFWLFQKIKPKTEIRKIPTV